MRGLDPLWVGGLWSAPTPPQNPPTTPAPQPQLEPPDCPPGPTNLGELAAEPKSFLKCHCGRSPKFEAHPNSCRPRMGFRAQKGSGGNDIFIWPLEQSVMGGKGHPQNGGQNWRSPLAVFWGLVAAPAPPTSPLDPGVFLFLGAVSSRKLEDPLSLPLPPPGCRPLSMGGHRQHPKTTQEKSPKSEGVPEEMGSATECPTRCTTQGGDPQIPHFPIFKKKKKKKKGVHPPQAEAPPNIFSLPPFPKEERD